MKRIPLLVVIMCLAATRGMGADGAPQLPQELRPLAVEARERFANSDFAGAERSYRAILAKAPNNLYALSNLGVVFFRVGKLAAAEEVLKKAAALAPEDGFSYSTLGIVYYGQGKYDEAVDALTNALFFDPKNATAHEYLAEIAEIKGQRHVSEMNLRKAMKLDPCLQQPTPVRGVGDYFTPWEKTRFEIPPAARK